MKQKLGFRNNAYEWEVEWDDEMDTWEDVEQMIEGLEDWIEEKTKTANDTEENNGD